MSGTLGKRAKVIIVFPDDIARVIGAAREASRSILSGSLDSKPLEELYRAVVLAFSPAMEAKPTDVLMITFAQAVVLPPPERALDVAKMIEESKTSEAKEPQ